MIIDTNWMSLFSLPINCLKKLMKVLANNYRSRSYKIYIVRAPWSISIPFAIAKAFLEKVTIDKINITSKAIHPKMFDHINRS